MGERALEFIEFIASRQRGEYCMVLRLRKRDCLGKEQSIFALELLVGALQIQLQFDIVTDMLLFRIIIQRILTLQYVYTSTKPPKYILLYMQQTAHDLFFIRHGQSLKNQAAQEYRAERNLPFDWDIFVKDPYFIQSVTHNPDLIDCHLSPKGVQQCLQAQANLKDLQPDLILCSPLQRALQTCRLVFPDRKCPRIVEPLLSETFKHSSQVCRSIQLKKEEFSQFDFSRVQAEGEFWFIKNDSFENQQKYFDFLKQIEGSLYRQKVEKITQFMGRQKMREQPSNVRDRARKVKQILKEYRKKYQKIAIVSHFYTIQFLCCKLFDANNEPKEDIHMKNCQALEMSLQEICKY